MQVNPSDVVGQMLAAAAASSSSPSLQNNGTNGHQLPPADMLSPQHYSALLEASRTKLRQRVPDSDVSVCDVCVRVCVRESLVWLCQQTKGQMERRKDNQCLLDVRECSKSHKKSIRSSHSILSPARAKKNPLPMISSLFFLSSCCCSFFLLVNDVPGVTFPIRFCLPLMDSQHHGQHHEYHELNESESTPRDSRAGSNESSADLGVNARGEPELVTHLL